MIKLRVVCGIFFVLAVVHSADLALENTEVEAAQKLQQIEPEIVKRRNKEVEAEWAYASNITDENDALKTEVSADNAKYFQDLAKELKSYNYENFKDEDLKRQFEKLTQLGYAALNDNDYRELLGAISRMQTNFAKVKVCSFKDSKKCDLALEPEIEEVITKSTDPEELKHYWVEFYNKAGTPVRKDFDKYVELNKKAAELNGYKSGAEYWLSFYEDSTFEKQLENIFDTIRPLYEQVHGYVRYRLKQKYGDIIDEKKPLPMHLLGNMWAQSWEDISPLVIPFPGKASVDVTPEMVKQGYTPKKMFEMGNEFFESLNMSSLPQTFWDKSIIEKPADGRELVCHASAWDFFKKDDVRIKQCTRVTMDQLFTVHHELGHIQYYLQYQYQPSVYREGANPGFHEAVGDVLSLSVSTSKHLKKIGLLSDYSLDKETRINKLFLTALSKIVFLPFAFTLDKYRWGIFRGDIKPEDYNCAFWKLRDSYSGIEPPVHRNEDDFDPPAKYHISADVEYLRYLVSFIVQFQFYKTACIKAGQYDPKNPNLPLDDCDFYGSAEAGNAFKQMLEMGSSKPWPDAMEVFTGEREMSGDALMEYFKPLYDWLKEENEKLNVHIGWEPSDKCNNANAFVFQSVVKGLIGICVLHFVLKQFYN